MQNSIPELDPELLRKLKIDVIIISNGHWQIIKKYRGSWASALLVRSATGAPAHMMSLAPQRS